MCSARAAVSLSVQTLGVVFIKTGKLVVQSAEYLPGIFTMLSKTYLSYQKKKFLLMRCCNCDPCIHSSQTSRTILLISLLYLPHLITILLFFGDLPTLTHQANVFPVLDVDCFRLIADVLRTN